MRVQQIRNATVKIEYDGAVFLVDPWLQSKGIGFSAKAIVPSMVGIKTPLNDLPFSPEEVLSGIDWCIVTHIHPDHFTEDFLPHSIHLIFQNKTDTQKANAMGFTDIEYFETDTIQKKNLNVQKVLAIHGDNSRLVADMGEGSGYIFRSAAEPCLYIAGDTVLCDEVKTIISEQKPDVIILNCCAATNLMGRLLMNAEELLEVSKLAPNAKIIASHLDSVNHALLSSNDIREFVNENHLENVYVPYNGKCLTF